MSMSLRCVGPATQKDGQRVVDIYHCYYPFPSAAYNDLVVLNLIDTKA